MSRAHRPSTAAQRLVRWWLVALALTGLGVLQAGHCVDHSTPAAITMPSLVQRDAVAAGLSTDPVVHQAGPAADGHHPAHGDPPSPASNAGHCQPQTTAAVGPISGTTAAAPHRQLIRLVDVGADPPMPSSRVLPAVALAALGVMRT